MPEEDERPVERFLRRTQATDEVTLRRNLDAGVYGAPGSPVREVAEVALARRRSETTRAAEVARTEDVAVLRASTSEARRLASLAIVLAAAALVVAVAAIVVVLRTP